MGTFARAILTVKDLSLIVGNAVSGVNALHGITERGELGKSFLCRNWDEYTRQLGGLLDPSVSLFPMYAKRCLDAGGIVRVSRAMHYTNPADIATATSVKATINNAGLQNFAGQVIFFDDGTRTVIIAGDFTPFIAAAQAVNLELPLGAGTTADVVISVTLQGGNTVIVLTSFSPGDVTINSTLEWSKTFVGDLALQAKDYGDFANGKLWFEIKAPVSGLPNVVDIFIGNDEYPSLNDEFRDVAEGITLAADLLLLTNGNRWVNFLSNTLTLVVHPKKYFASGTHDTVPIDATDIMGDISQMTGIHAFDNANDFVRLSVPEFTQNSIDNALVDFCEQRQDCIPFLRVPTGLTSNASIDYRKAQGVYAGGVVIDTHNAAMVMSDIEITEEFTGERLFITSLPDVLAAATKKDNRIGAWGSFSGIQNESGAGVIRATFGVGDKNLAQPAKKIDADLVTAAGLIPVIGKETRRFGFATIIWGNSSLQLLQNTLLKFLHVVELTIHAKRVAKPIIEEFLFLPNDVTSWKNLFRAQNALYRGLVDSRAISEFEYIGDQDVDRIQDAVFNQQADIQNGIYKFKVILVPTLLMEQIELTFTIQNNLIGVEINNA